MKIKVAENGNTNTQVKYLKVVLEYLVTFNHSSVLLPPVPHTLKTVCR